MRSDQYKVIELLPSLIEDWVRAHFCTIHSETSDIENKFRRLCPLWLNKRISDSDLFKKRIAMTFAYESIQIRDIVEIFGLDEQSIDRTLESEIADKCSWLDPDDITEIIEKAVDGRFVDEAQSDLDDLLAGSMKIDFRKCVDDLAERIMNKTMDSITEVIWDVMTVPEPQRGDLYSTFSNEELDEKWKKYKERKKK